MSYSNSCVPVLSVPASPSLTGRSPSWLARQREASGWTDEYCTVINCPVHVYTTTCAVHTVLISNYYSTPSHPQSSLPLCKRILEIRCHHTRYEHQHPQEREVESLTEGDFTLSCDLSLLRVQCLITGNRSWLRWVELLTKVKYMYTYVALGKSPWVRVWRSASEAALTYQSRYIQSVY